MLERHSTWKALHLTCRAEKFDNKFNILKNLDSFISVVSFVCLRFSGMHCIFWKVMVCGCGCCCHLLWTYYITTFLLVESR